MDEERIPVIDRLGDEIGVFIPKDGGAAGCLGLIFIVLVVITFGIPIWLFKKGADRWREGKKQAAFIYWTILLILIVALPLATYLEDKVAYYTPGAVRHRVEQQATQTAQVQQYLQPTGTATSTPKQQAVPTPRATIVKPTSGTTPILYVVQKGDTLGKIAAQYQVSVESIAKLNNIQNVDLIVVGQRLIIPKPPP